MSSSKSISHLLLRRIFGLYLIVAIIVTLGQLSFSYIQVKEDFKNELVSMVKSSNQTLSTAIWNFNDQVVLAELNGLLHSSRMIGIRLYSEDLKLTHAIGETVSLNGQEQSKEFYFKSNTKGDFSLIWPLTSVDLRGEDRIISYLEVFSHDALVFNRLKLDVFVIVFNALLKTTALWLIILIALRQVLTKPLKIMTHDVEHIDEFKETPTLFSQVKSDALELYTLQDGFKRMLARLNQAFIRLSESEKRLEAQAKHDSLTQLPNRAFFEEQSAKMIKIADTNQTHLALLYFDLNGFKKINDSYGHFVGDQLLIQVSARLQNVVAKDDFLARIGGDEFVVLTSLKHHDDIYSLVKRIVIEFDHPFLIESYTIICNPSIGVSYYPEAESLVQMLKQADVAMYEAKKSDNAVDGVNFYTDEMALKHSRSKKIESMISDAIKHGEMTTYFQPVVSSIDGTVSSVEALIRWESEELGWVSPDEFISIAENTPVINEITRAVLTDCHDLLERAKEADITLGSIAVNISASQITSSIFTDLLFEWVEKYELPLTKISVELTERQIIHNEVQSNDQLNRLRSEGVKIALDDFGVGYSSLTHLLKMPVDILKLDRSLIDGIDRNTKNQALVAGIIEMSQRMGMSVVAEGVERKEEYDLVADMGCHYIQGYYCAKPMPIKQLIEFIK